jgi:hypothetical protein
MTFLPQAHLCIAIRPEIELEGDSRRSKILFNLCMKTQHPCGMSKSTSSLPSPLSECLRWKRFMWPLPQNTFHAGICDAARQTYMVTRTRFCHILGETEYAHFPNVLVDLPTSMWSM